MHTNPATVKKYLRYEAGFQLHHDDDFKICNVFKYQFLNPYVKLKA